MQKIVPLFILFTILAGCGTEEKPKPREDARYKRIDIHYTQNPDGTVDYSYSHELDLYTNLAFRRLYGESFIVYDPRHQELAIQRSVTTTAEGKKVPSPDNAYNKVLPRFVQGAPPYAHLREMVVSHTGLGPGSRISFAYTLHSDSTVYPFFSGKIDLLRTAPTDELHITVTFPKAYPVSYRIFNQEAAIKKSSANGLQSYSWTFKDLPASTQEPHQPSSQAYKPFLSFSEADYTMMARIYKNTIHTDMPAPLRQRIDKLAAGAGSSLDTVQKVLQVVAEEIALYPVPQEYHPFYLQSNSEIWQGNGATPIEKVQLLAAALNYAGVDAIPVLLLHKDLALPNLACPLLAEQTGVKIKIPELGRIILDPTRAQLEDIQVYYPGYHIITIENLPPAIPPMISNNRTHNAFKCRLEADKSLTFSGKGKAALSFQAFPYLRLHTQPGLIKALQPFPVENTTSKTIHQELHRGEVEYTYEGLKLTEAYEGYFIMELPTRPETFCSWLPGPLPENRQSPLALPSPILEKTRYELSLPAGYTLLNPQHLKEENKIGTLQAVIRQHGNKIIVKREIEIRKRVIMPEGYPAFFQLWKTWNLPKSKEIILKKQVKG